jgi:hypothetical protein
MKNVILLSFLFTNIIFPGTAQNCLPGGITFDSQSAIDNFTVNYPGCTVIEGVVAITGEDITNLDGLSIITAFEDDLAIEDNPLLSSLAGLSNVTYIGGDFDISVNPLLTDLAGLGSLAHIGRDLSLEFNPGLVSLSGIESLESIGAELVILENLNLGTLSGLDSVSLIYGPVGIAGNPLLSVCSVKSICEYLGAGGPATIQNNSAGCDNVFEVKVECFTYVDDHETKLDNTLTFYPNPCSGILFIEFTCENTSKLCIYNSSGQVVRQVTLILGINEIDVSVLPNGFYFLSFFTSQELITRKLAIY